MMKKRGYSTKRYNTLQTSYHNKPTPLQKASYDVHLISLIKSHNTDDLHNILQSGISPNPCNNYGESLVHMVCRRGDEELLQIMIQNGCCIHVADDYGRTPLHDACWAASPAFPTVELLLNKDVMLLQMTDCRGFLPLSYVRKDHWEQWNDFLRTKKDTYWPKVTTEQFQLQQINAAGEALLLESSRHHRHNNNNNINNNNGKNNTRTSDRTQLRASDRVLEKPNTRPIPDPNHALPLDIAALVAAGTISPDEAIKLRNRRLRPATTTKKKETNVEEGGGRE
jgi:ankyrin repeat protein